MDYYLYLIIIEINVNKYQQQYILSLKYRSYDVNNLRLMTYYCINIHKKVILYKNIDII
jgi:hypothetical protein